MLKSAANPAEQSPKFPFAERWASLLRSALLWDSVSYFASKIVPGLMGLISVPVFIRLIGLDQYGRFAVAVPILMAVGGASSGWLAQGLLRFHPIASDPVERRLAFDRAVTAATLATVFVTCIALASALAGLRTSLLAALASLAFCLSFVTYTVALAKFQARLQPAMVLRREIVRSAGCFILPVAFILLAGRKQFELLLLGQALAYAIALLSGPHWFRQGKQDSNPGLHLPEAVPVPSSPASQTIAQLLRFGWAIGLWLLLSQALPVIDRWTIQKFSGYASAGVYASLYEVAIRSFSFLVFPLTQAAHPRIMRAWNEGRLTESYRIIRHSVHSQLVIFVGAFAAVVAGAHPITRIIVGYDDTAAAHLLPVLFVGGFLWQFALLIHKPLEIEQRTGAMLAAMAVIVALNLVACFELVPRFGYAAAAYILVSSACVYIALVLCMTRFGALRNFQPLPEPQWDSCD